MKVLDLFSGIGGFSLGLEKAGMETIAFCEFDKHAQKILKKHWPNVPIYEDVRTLDGKQFRGTVDVVCGGYPCQPFSTAGKRNGAEDDRHLWPEMLRIIKESRPRWVIAENVAGHISMGLDTVLSDLEAEGYAWWTFVIPACAVDARHRRDRVWILATNSNGNRLRDKQEFKPRVKSATKPWHDGQEESMADPESIGRHEEQTQDASSIGSQLQRKAGGRCSQPRNRKWLPEPGVGRVVNGVPRRVDRIKRLGNAVVPQIPEAIGRAIMKAEGKDVGG